MYDRRFVESFIKIGPSIWAVDMTGFILKIKEQIPKFSQTFFKDFYRLLPGKYLKRLQKEWFEKWYLD